MKCEMSLEEFFYGSATVGERGQVVIPAEARKQFDIHPGDKLLVMRHPHEGGIILCKIDAMREFVTGLMEGLSAIETRVAENEGESNGG
ncbi:MAG: AbrB/MazE/SpoVT family DNA-binding domain-containing protein [Armatimonadetes bacterium]|nr:AbrB/MazE/SpoVT family DNA-binding domain-containing protein [Armatimonadota bacterium]